MTLNRASLWPALSTKWILVCAILFLRASPLLSKQAQSGVLQHLESAQQAQVSGDLETAAREYQDALRIQPNIPEVYADLGLVYYAENKFSDSAKALSRADSLKPGLRGVSLFLGIDEVKLGFASMAVPNLERAVQLEPKSKEANVWLATALWDTGKASESLARLRSINELYPTDIDILFLLSEEYRKTADKEAQAALTEAAGTCFVDQIYGDIYAQQRSWLKAAFHYQHAIQVCPRSDLGYFGMGVVSLRQDKLEKARTYFLRVLQIDPSSPAARARLGEVDFLKNLPAEGLALLNASAQMAPGDAVRYLDIHPDLMTMNEHYDGPMVAEVQRSIPALKSAPDTTGRNLSLALVEARLGNHGEAAKYWSSFNSAAWPKREHRANQRDRGVSDFDRERYGKAASELGKWLAMHPDDSRSRYLLSMTYNIVSRTLVEHMLSLDPQSIRIHQLVAESYENSGDDYRALDEYNIVAKMDPYLPGVHFEIGKLLRKHQELAKAQIELQDELNLNQDHVGANAEMGMLLLDEHAPGSAIPYLKKALKLAPDLTLIHQQLGEAYYMNKQYPEAEKELMKAVAYDQDGTAHYFLGLVYRSEGNKVKANEEFAIARRMKSAAVQDEVTKMSRVNESR